MSGYRKTQVLRALPLLAGLAAPQWASAAGSGGPTLWGYGVKSCSDFLTAAPEAAAAELGNEGYIRYREWLAGLVSGLSLATGSDVLKGAELDAAMTRIRAHCQAHPTDDFFNASLALFKSLGRPQKEKRR